MTSLNILKSLRPLLSSKPQTILLNSKARLISTSKLVLLSNSNTESSGSTRYYLISYKYPPDFLDKRAVHRQSHLKYVTKYAKEGKLLLFGSMINPVDSGASVLKVGGLEEAEKFCKEDPFVKEGVVEGFNIREWNVVLGKLHC